MEGTNLFEAYNFAPMDQNLANNNDTKKGTSIADVRQAQVQAQQTQAHAQAQQQVQQQQPAPEYEYRYPQEEQRPAPQQQQQPEKRERERERERPSYFDTMLYKRKDVLKLISIAVIILLALSLHAVVDFGLKEVIMTGDFTFKQEMGIRLLYPVAIVFFLWNMKALGSR
jgi:cation transport ATPase